MFCDHCGSEIPQNAKFCFACDTPIQQTKDSKTISKSNPLLSRLLVVLGWIGIISVTAVLVFLFFHADFHLLIPKNSVTPIAKPTLTSGANSGLTAHSNAKMKYECR